MILFWLAGSSLHGVANLSISASDPCRQFAAITKVGTTGVIEGVQGHAHQGAQHCQHQAPYVSKVTSLSLSLSHAVRFHQVFISLEKNIVRRIMYFFIRQISAACICMLAAAMYRPKRKPWVFDSWFSSINHSSPTYFSKPRQTVFV